MLRWNTDKPLPGDLAAAACERADRFVEADDEPLLAVRDLLEAFPEAEEFVVKPAVGAGSRDTQRYARAQEFAAGNHIARLLEGGRSVLLQPYLMSVDSHGETALLYFDGVFSHAIRKGPLLRPNQEPTDHLSLRGDRARVQGEDERHIAAPPSPAIRSAPSEAPLTYARVD